MDVTHVPSFKKLSFLHVTVDTFSHFTHVSARTGEAVKDVVQHLSQCFQIMGFPSQIKTDNGPTYTSKAFASFCQQWGIKHVTRIPYNPQGQTIIKRTHQVVKTQIKKLQKSNNVYFTPHHVLSHSLFVINHLNLNNQGVSATLSHWDREVVKSPLPKIL